MKTILGVGIATMDYLLEVPRYPPRDTKNHCSSFITSGGGNCANTLVALSRLGLQTKMVTRTGDDAIAGMIVSSLQEEGVGTDAVVKGNGESPFSVIIVGKEDSSRTIIHRSGGDYTVGLPCPERVLDGVDLVYCDGRFSPTVLNLCPELRQKGVPLVVEAERTGLGVERLFRYADIIVTSRDYLGRTLGENRIEPYMRELKKTGVRCVITTLGADGSLCLTDNGIIKQPAFETAVVDTTGAGDAFIAGVVYGTLHDWEIERCLRFAAELAARKCRKPGARDGLPYRGEMGVSTFDG
ncbi:MAG: hypothetical protein JW881_03470 [Spirochaetales bacterium]|nr:hypothetical protein [Spirochaetales bacterium]